MSNTKSEYIVQQVVIENNKALRRNTPKFLENDLSERLAALGQKEEAPAFPENSQCTKFQKLEKVQTNAAEEFLVQRQTVPSKMPSRTTTELCSPSSASHSTAPKKPNNELRFETHLTGSHTGIIHFTKKLATYPQNHEYKLAATFPTKSNSLPTLSATSSVAANASNIVLFTIKDTESALLKSSENQPLHLQPEMIKLPSASLKLIIPEHTDDLSSSSHISPLFSSPAASSKTTILPKVTSPQILEQHISKIISENAVIVETLDPLWSKRYLRQSSMSSYNGVEKEIKKVNGNTMPAIKPRRFSEDLGASKKSVFEGGSKLENALLGKAKRSKEFKPAIITSIPLLSTKSAPSTSEPPNPQESHPQNPEGSIIKDLLLKSRHMSSSQSNVNTITSPEGTTPLPAGFTYKMMKAQDIKLSEGLMCKQCNIIFRSKENLEVHKRQFCKFSVAEVDTPKETADPSPKEELNSGTILKRQLLSPIVENKFAKKRKSVELAAPAGNISMRSSIIRFEQNQESNCVASSSLGPSTTETNGDTLPEAASIAKPEIVKEANEANDLESLKPAVVSLEEADFKIVTCPDLVLCDDTPDSPSSPKTISKPTVQRPTDLAIPRDSSQTVSALISPDVPRPKKTCLQTYIDGHAYTYLGLKCSTRPTYCSVYRPQPNFVQHDSNPKLSMYSNWQVVSAEKDPSGLTPGQLSSFYNSRQKRSRLTYTTATKDSMVFTHSSYWTFRTHQNSKDIPTVPEEEEAEEESEQDVEENEPLLEEQELIESQEFEPISNDNSTFADQQEDPNLEYEESSQDEDEDLGEEGAPKRVKIFEGGFKTSENYTYVRGRGRGRYVCEECGIRCKKPSMLKKHIRTHTDVRPYKCRHCAFAFKTKGNLTKHMKSKAHHKKCLDLGIIPVPTIVEDSQIDGEALAKQEKLEQLNRPLSDDEDDGDEDDSDGEADSDDDLRSPIHFSQSNVDEICGLQKQQEEQEAAESLLNLSSLPATPELCSKSHSPVIVWSSSHRQRSYSMEQRGKCSFLLDDDLLKLPRRYSISATREAWRNLAQKSSEEQPMDLRISKEPPVIVKAQRGSSNSTLASSPTTVLSVFPALTSLFSGSSLSSPPYLPDDITEFDDPPMPLLAEQLYNTPITPITPEENLTPYFIPVADSKDICVAKEEAPSSPPSSSTPTVNILPKPKAQEDGQGKCVCSICNKTFSKVSQLRLHVNIHYFERPFKCESCAVSFRTKGHLQKHKRSVSHFNKVNMNITFGTATTDNPRPFKCGDCKIAFRIHGHLAKHLRSKMHIMKLECIGKLPFGTFAEMERSCINMNDIETGDCESSLKSLQIIAKALYQKNPKRLRWQNDPNLTTSNIEKSLPALNSASSSSSSSLVISLVPETSSIPSALGQEPGSPTLSSQNVFLSPSATEETLKEGGENTISLLQRSFMCHLCGRSFKSNKFLQIHLYCDHSSSKNLSNDLMLSQEPSFMCHQCGKTYLLSSDFQSHLQNHLADSNTV